jgi:outer membrane protein OmpA-like peptidoglycan-associated protein
MRCVLIFLSVLVLAAAGAHDVCRAEEQAMPPASTDSTSPPQDEGLDAATRSVDELLPQLEKKAEEVPAEPAKGAGIPDGATKADAEHPVAATGAAEAPPSEMKGAPVENAPGPAPATAGAQAGLPEAGGAATESAGPPPFPQEPVNTIGEPATSFQHSATDSAGALAIAPETEGALPVTAPVPEAGGLSETSPMPEVATGPDAGIEPMPETATGTDSNAQPMPEPATENVEDLKKIIERVEEINPEKSPPTPPAGEPVVHVEARIDGKKVVLPRPVIFQKNWAVLEEDYLPEIEAVARMLKEAPKLKIRVEGNSDEAGSPEYNMALSEYRAIWVRLILLSYGIEPERIQVKGMGIENPVADNQSPGGRKKNRRVEFFVIGK